MDDEGLRRDEINRAQAAADLLAHPLLAEAFAGVERGYIEAWASSTTPDGRSLTLGPAERERLWNAVQVIRSVRAALEAHIRTGDMARRQIEDAAGVERGLWGRLSGGLS